MSTFLACWKPKWVSSSLREWGSPDADEVANLSQICSDEGWAENIAHSSAKNFALCTHALQFLTLRSDVQQHNVAETAAKWSRKMYLQSRYFVLGARSNVYCTHARAVSRNKTERESHIPFPTQSLRVVLVTLLNYMPDVVSGLSNLFGVPK